MQESTYPAGAVALPRAPSKKPIVAALVALLVGAGITAGVFLLTDGDTTTTTRTIVSTPVSPGAGTAAKNEAAVAASVGSPPRTIVPTPVGPGAGTAAKNEAAVAASVGSPGFASPESATRYDGGPDEGTRGPAAAQPHAP